MPAARTSKRGKKAAPKKKPVEEEEEEVAVEQSEDKIVADEEPSAAAAAPPETNSIPAETPPEPPADDSMTGVEPSAPALTMEERKAKMDQLRQKRAASHKANRASLVEESAKAQISARDAARLEKQRKLAEMLRTKADAEERGEPDAVERAKNWEWTIEENDYWEKKKARKARRADFEFHGAFFLNVRFRLGYTESWADDAHAARRRYKKDLDLIKPDLAAYNRQKELAMGLAPGTLTAFNPTASSSQVRGPFSACFYD
jgi:pre-mRNA-splicing factor SYF2